MNITLRIWRQVEGAKKGAMVKYHVEDVSPDMSFLEMLDVLNEHLTLSGDDPVAFDSDCREGICGMCSLVINGIAHGPESLTAVCQLHMRHFSDGDIIDVEPWRSGSFPIVKDLVVDRSAMDRSFRPAATSLRLPELLRTPTQPWYLSLLPTTPLMPRSALGAGPA